MVRGKQIYCGLLLAGGLGFCQSGYTAAVQCESYTVKTSDGEKMTGMVCFEARGGGGSSASNSPHSRNTGGGGSTPELSGYKHYVSSHVDPDGNGIMNCYKNLTESSQDNYHMDSGDRFAPDRIHPVTGKLDDHNGIDIQAKVGTPAYSLAFGYVSEVGRNKLNGDYVRIKWWQGPFEFEATYIHLVEGSIAVTHRQTVFPGTPIGGVGETGNTTGPHLHLQLKRTESLYEPNPNRHKPKKFDTVTELVDPLAFLGGDTCNKL